MNSSACAQRWRTRRFRSSLRSAATVPPAAPWTAQTKSAARSASPAAEAIDIGDARKGLDYAQKICAVCHNVLATGAASPNKQAPPFKKIANTPGMTVTALTVWSRTTHPTMPNLVINPADMDDLIAYILGLRDRK
jgi:mono/diheme cytochrome c family protein